MSDFKEWHSDELKLIVEPSITGRRIVPVDVTQERFVSEDGQVYSDENWRVKLYVANTKYRVCVTYRGKNSVEGDKHRTHFEFETGSLTISVYGSPKQDKSYSRIHWSGVINDEVLSRDYGIPDGYVYGSPNQSWNIDDGSEYIKLAVVSNGTVECHCGDEKCLTNPTIEEIAAMDDASKAHYEVSGATWSVVCFYRDDLPATLVLYTDAARMADVFDSLEQYLERFELAGFDELLRL